MSERVEPPPGLSGEAAHHAAFLAYYRETVIEKCASLPEPELRRPHVPSGWTMLELVQHLALMERRWVVWGFLGDDVADPWGDSAGDAYVRWYVTPERHLTAVVELLRTQARRTEEILSGTSLDAVAASAGRFHDVGPDELPELRWICFHVLQEYARHAGHLGVAVELAGGRVGE